MFLLTHRSPNLHCMDKWQAQGPWVQPAVTAILAAASALHRQTVSQHTVLSNGMATKCDMSKDSESPVPKGEGLLVGLC